MIFRSNSMLKLCSGNVYRYCFLTFRSLINWEKKGADMNLFELKSCSSSALCFIIKTCIKLQFTIHYRIFSLTTSVLLSAVIESGCLFQQQNGSKKMIHDERRQLNGWNSILETAFCWIMHLATNVRFIQSPPDNGT